MTPEHFDRRLEAMYVRDDASRERMAARQAKEAAALIRAAIEAGALQPKES